MKNLLKFEDIVGDVIYINMEDVSFIKTNIDSVIVKFKNNENEHHFDKIKNEGIEKIRKGIRVSNDK